VSEGFFTVYLGLNLPQEKMKEYLKIPHVFYSDDNPDADFYNSNDENFFEKTWVLLYSPSLMNAELASEGNKIISCPWTLVPCSFDCVYHEWQKIE